MDVLNIVLPPFLLVIVGYLTKRLNYVSADLVPALITFFLKVAVPAAMIIAIGSQPIGQLLSLWRFFLALLVVTLITFFFAYFSARIFSSMNQGERSFFALASSFTNAVMLGLPLLYQVFGMHAIGYAAISIILAAIVLAPIGLVFVELYESQDGLNVFKVFANTFVKVIKTPLIISGIIGVVLSSIHFQFPYLLKTFLSLLAASAAPVALFAVGLDVELKIFKFQFNTIFWVSLFKLICMPLLAIGASLLFSLRPEESVALLICTAVPTGKSVFALTKAHNVYAEEGAASVVGTTVISIVTVTLFLFWAHAIWPQAFTHIHQVSF